MGSPADKGPSRRTVIGLFGAAAGAVGATAIGGPAWAAPGAPRPGVPAAGPMADSAIGTPATRPAIEQLRGETRLYQANFRGKGVLPAVVDEWVLHAQQWVNTVYGGRPGFVPAPENGRTGWPTMFALTRALQLEVGLSGDQLSDTFGPTTLARVTSMFGNIGGGAPTNVIRIVQCGLYCKGYTGDNLSGTYSGTTGDSVLSMRRNMGFTDGRRELAPKEFKALLTMDAYVVVENGSTRVRSVQQWMNNKFVGESWFFIIPCDGHSSRDVAKALIYALQFELGVAGANGNFGPGTKAALRARPRLTVGSADSGSSSFVRLFQAGMIFNLYEVAFDGVFTQAVSDQVTSFQQFVALPVNGFGDFSTWCSLLVSNGDTDRRGAALDCVTTITPARATALFQAGYRVAGRYLTNVPNTTLDKKIKPGELATIFAAGMRVFPIYQTFGGEASYFNQQQGGRDASLAMAAASDYGFERGTIIYYSVDFDALNEDVTTNVIPHFRAIRQAMDYYGNPYRVGVYGARNVCSRLLADGLAVTSFVSDLSTGFSGNLGFSMPRNWAFDQISTITVGSGAGSIEIDNNIYSGRDAGVSRVIDRPTPALRLDTYFDLSLKSQVSSDLNAYADQVTSNKTGLKHSMDEALDVVVAYDELITNLSRSFGVRKALIQTPVFWEYWKQTPLDNVADGLVVAWYAYQHAFEAWQEFPVGPAPTPPIGGREDCSTGISQIFAATAIRGRNWAVGQGLIAGNTLDGGNWHVVEDVWNSLHDNGNYNIGTVPLVLFEGGAQVGVSGIRLDYSDTDLRRILARYNGTGPDSDHYGVELHGVYQIFERYNATLR
jgi:peptidoglycan hydrolase-like protein with peptidoglycan-binding domain